MASFMNKTIWLLIVALLVLASCKNKGGSKGSSLPEKVLNNDFTFSYFSTKAKVDYLDTEQNLSTPVQIRICQDSAIWMSITPALGIEMVRILIRKDSVFMINRLKKEYYAGSFELIQQQLGLKVNYVLVEKLILGNIPLKSTSSQKLTKTETHLILEQMLKDFMITNKVSKTNARLDEIDISGKDEDITTIILYGDFQAINDVDFAHHIKMSQHNSGRKTTIDVQYGKVKTSDEPLNMHFSIPDTYERITLP